MKLLAFDTSTRWLSVAAMSGTRWALRDELAGQGHAERLLPLVDEVLAETGLALGELDAIAFGAGPGSFTGVRIACGVAQGLGLGAYVPLVPVPTLEALAETAWRERGAVSVLAALDARMREVYVAAYRREAGRWRIEAEPAVLHPDEVSVPPDAQAWFGAGDGFASYPELAAQLGLAASDAGLQPTARSLVVLAQPRVAAGEAVAAGAALPLYVRHRVALTTAEREGGQRL